MRRAQATGLQGQAGVGRLGSGNRATKGMKMGDPLLAPSQGILGKHLSKHSPLVLQ